jgi:hypothetical protein
MILFTQTRSAKTIPACSFQKRNFNDGSVAAETGQVRHQIAYSESHFSMIQAFSLPGATTVSRFLT